MSAAPKHEAGVRGGRIIGRGFRVGWVRIRIYCMSELEVGEELAMSNRAVILSITDSNQSGIDLELCSVCCM